MSHFPQRNPTQLIHCLNNVFVIYSFFPRLRWIVWGREKSIKSQKHETDFTWNQVTIIWSRNIITFGAGALNRTCTQVLVQSKQFITDNLRHMHIQYRSSQ